MITTTKIDEIASRAARAKLPNNVVERVFSEPTVDSWGADALRLTIVIAANSVERIDGDSLLDTLVQIQHDLQNAGEERFAIVEYATQAELDDVSSEI